MSARQTCDKKGRLCSNGQLVVAVPPACVSARPRARPGVVLRHPPVPKFGIFAAPRSPERAAAAPRTGKQTIANKHDEWRDSPSRPPTVQRSPLAWTARRARVQGAAFRRCAALGGVGLDKCKRKFHPRLQSWPGRRLAGARRNFFRGFSWHALAPLDSRPQRSPSHPPWPPPPPQPPRPSRERAWSWRLRPRALERAGLGACAQRPADLWLRLNRCLWRGPCPRKLQLPV